MKFLSPKSVLINVFSIATIVAVLLFSCDNEKGGPSDDFKFLMKSDSNLFRGAYLGMPVNDLMRIESQQPEQVDSSSILYLFTKDSTELAFYSELDQGKIIEIEADLSLSSPQKARDVLEKIIQHYDKIIGEHVRGKGAFYWNGESRGEVFNIELSDVSSVQYGRIMLTIHY